MLTADTVISFTYRLTQYFTKNLSSSDQLRTQNATDHKLKICLSFVHWTEYSRYLFFQSWNVYQIWSLMKGVMWVYNNIYEFQIHSNSLIRISKNEKRCSQGPFLSTILIINNMMYLLAFLHFWNFENWNSHWTKNSFSNDPWDFHVSVNFRSMFEL